MPANMISALVTSRPRVSGSRRATAMAGPMPGRTPMAVPSSTPSRAKARFVGVSAVPKPSTRELNASI
jgi:hypothetical protein